MKPRSALSPFSFRSNCWLVWLAFVVICLGCSLGHVCHGQQIEDSADQIWLVSMRGVSSCLPSVGEANRMAYWKHQANVGWQCDRKTEFLQSVGSVGFSTVPIPVCVYVHENRVTAEEAFSRAVIIHRRLREAAAPGSQFRLVVISWPSDRIGIRPRPDTQIKARRSEVDGYYLAWLLDQIDPQAPVSLFGHSFGPRMIASALHLLGGGSIDGYCLPHRVHPHRQPMRVVLLASAFDAGGLLPGHSFGQALTPVGQLLVLFNQCDPVLHLYPRLYGRGGPPALGYVGLQTSRLRPIDRPKVQQMNVSGAVGKSHSWRDYEGSAAMMSRIIPHLLPN